MQDFIDAPVKTYSSGMYMRLGFAVAMHVDPDVLLVDEVLAVGDQGFTHKCLDKFAEFRRRNKSILLVTHSLDLVEKFCDDAHWLDTGVTKGEGDPKRVVAAYSSTSRTRRRTSSPRPKPARVAQAAAPRRRATEAAAAARPGRDRAKHPPDRFKADEGRWGTREVEITNVTIVGADGEAGHVFQSGEPIRSRIDCPRRRKRSPTSSSASASSTPTTSASTAPTPISRNFQPTGSTATAT